MIWYYIILYSWYLRIYDIIHTYNIYIHIYIYIYSYTYSCIYMVPSQNIFVLCTCIKSRYTLWEKEGTKVHVCRAWGSSTIYYNTTQYITTYYNTKQYSTIHYNTMHYNNQSHIAKHGVPKGLAARRRRADNPFGSGGQRPPPPCFTLWLCLL